jgi:hypothetical protein
VSLMGLSEADEGDCSPNGSVTTRMNARGQIE